MFKVYKKEIEVAGKKISLETGKVARQADGAIIATCGETVVLATVVGAKKVNPDVDYFPLSVNYQEKYYAAGKIPGGFYMLLRVMQHMEHCIWITIQQIHRVQLLITL